MSPGAERSPGSESDVGVQFRYLSARIPRHVDRQGVETACPRLPAPVQVIRGLAPEQHETIRAKTPSYLLIEFEDREIPNSAPLADLSSLR